MHFVGNLLIDVTSSLDRARSEAYLVAMHRLRANARKPVRDFWVGLRCVDDFALRDGEWRIANRVCAFEWSRIDPVEDSPFSSGPGDTMGSCDSEDVVFTEDLGTRIDASVSSWSLQPTEQLTESPHGVGTFRGGFSRRWQRAG
jgi:hypothetical protein